ncbi:tRNA (adenosine(37)-N6)-threonylcarbamoyltransferase complex dimerization subunit type 1 TsaB [Sunxiuqinia sp. A32]|uniref:tRNA (adenosine(37)-N6)-threonylcarbamoyltransferase complex dimerization subunit type 1 TsaB n=1 Tax=Sunxiuqinia sp. A32 TaxID=3461496 RepID=UPI0040455B07
MALILNLESSTEVCSVSLSDDGSLIDLIENFDGQTHARLLSVFAKDIMDRNKLNFNQLNAIAISKGPGSYTGLRIGVSLAKGLCYANNIPLIAISSLAAMSDHISNNLEKYGLDKSESLLFCPMIDARRMEVYNAIYDKDGDEHKNVSAEIIDENSFRELLTKNKLIFFGNGSEKCKKHINHENAIFVPGIQTSAQFMFTLSHKAFENNDFEDLAYFEPFYLKDFIAGIPKKNILNR